MMRMQSAWLSLGLVGLAATSCDLPRLPELPPPVDPAPFGLELLAGDIGGRGSVDGAGPAARFSFPNDVAIDGTGTLYVADRDNHTIRKVTAAGDVTTFGGTAGKVGSADGTGAAARFNGPSGVAVDSAGNVYVADAHNYIIRKVTPAGVVTTLAGKASTFGSADGTGAEARFDEPFGVAVDSAGNVYVADSANHTIRKVTAAGVVTTLAGTARMTGGADGDGAAARFYGPFGVAVDSAGNVYATDSGTLRKVTPAGVVTTLAGTAGVFGSEDGTGAAARFDFPAGVSVDRAGNLYVADRVNQTIRMVTAAGVVTTLAGTANMIGSEDGTGAARFLFPSSATVDSDGNLYVADRDNHTIRKVTADRVVTTIAGTAGLHGSADGTDTARFFFPVGVGVDSASNLYVADSNNHTIRKITTDGAVTTLAGSAGRPGSADGEGTAARFNRPSEAAVDRAGNLYVADRDNQTIRKITAAGVVTTLAGTPGMIGNADGTGDAARFGNPSGVAVDRGGNVYVADTGNHAIRKITPAGVVTKLAGLADSMPGMADGTGDAAGFGNPTGTALDSAGNIYVADSAYDSIRKVTPAGVVTTLAGSANGRGSADGTGDAAHFNGPSGVALDGAGNVYVADTSNATIRKITPTGTTTTVAGTAGVAGILLGATPRFAFPQRLAIVGDSIVISDGHAILLLRHGAQ